MKVALLLSGHFFFRKTNFEKYGKITLKAPIVAHKWFDFLGNEPIVT